MGTMAKIVTTFAVVISLAAVGFAQGPELTSEQKLRIERINLVTRVSQLEKENADLKVQLSSLQVAIERAKLQGDIEKANPDFVWDAQTGKFTEKKKEQPGGELR